MKHLLSPVMIILVFCLFGCPPINNDSPVTAQPGHVSNILAGPPPAQNPQINFPPATWNLPARTIEPVAVISQIYELKVMMPAPARIKIDEIAGTAPYIYQWYRCYEANDVLIKDATEAELVIPWTTMEDTGIYYCLINNAARQPISSWPIELIIEPGKEGEGEGIEAENPEMGI